MTINFFEMLNPQKGVNGVCARLTDLEAARFAIHSPELLALRVDDLEARTWESLSHEDQVFFNHQWVARYGYETTCEPVVSR